VPPLVALGDALGHAGEFDAAIERYRQALAIEPDQRRAVANLGIVLVGAGRNAEALPLLERAAARDPNDPAIAAALAAARAGRGASR